MALSPDQQAMLQLLLERGQSYADLAELLGGDEAAVRSRARATLQELAGADPDRNVGLTDYLLGQADPIGRADAVRHLKDDPDDLELATELSQKLRLLAPAADLPRLPGEQRAPSTSRRASGRDRRIKLPRPKTSLSSRQGRLLMALGSGALILVVVVLAIAGVFSGGGTEASGTTTTAAGGLSDKAARVTLSPTKAGGNASGVAVFATASAQQPYVELELTGLPQLQRGKAYVAWLMINNKVGHPLTPVPIDANGNYHQQIALADFQVPLAQKATAVAVSLSDAATLNKELKKALQNTTPVVPYQGTSVLLGTIPRGQSQS
jgi:hypothetical protein